MPMIGWNSYRKQPALSSTEPPKQIRSWERSAIWQLTSEMGTSYLKLVPDMFAHEAKLTHYLAQHFPDALPTLLPEIMPQSLHTADYGQRDLMGVTDLAQWKRATSIYAEMQVKLVNQYKALIEIGVPQRRLDWISEHLHDFLHDDVHLTRGDLHLNNDELQTIREAMPQLEDAIQQLRVSDIPYSLEHGDLWAGQIILHDGQVLITDWSDSALTCPFFSLAFFLTDIEQQFPDEPSARQQLEDAYLSVWSDYGELSTLRETYQVAHLLADVFNAMRYHYDWLPLMGQQWEMHNMVAYDLRLLLAKL